MARMIPRRPNSLRTSSYPCDANVEGRTQTIRELGRMMLNMPDH